MAELQKKKEQEAEKSAGEKKDKESSPNPVMKRAPEDTKTPHFQQKKVSTPYNAAHFSTGRAAAAFTSSVMTPVTVNERALIDENLYMYQRIKAKGYARLVTNFGNLNLELYCDKVRDKSASQAWT